MSFAMNQYSPGRRTADDDIEMFGIQENLLPNQNGDTDPQDDEDADDNQALLRTTDSRVSRHLGQKGSFVTIWPQIKGIVVEVSPDFLNLHDLSTRPPERSYPAYDHNQSLIHWKVARQGVGEYVLQPYLVLTIFNCKFLQHWRAMKEVDQLIIIVPTVLNLNGNLEMNLSSRLGTASNVGQLDDPVIRRSILTGSLALLQVQTISVSFIAACIALILGKFVPTTKSPRPMSTEEPNVVLRGTVNRLLDSNPGRKSGIPTYVLPEFQVPLSHCTFLTA